MLQSLSTRIKFSLIATVAATVLLVCNLVGCVYHPAPLAYYDILRSPEPKDFITQSYMDTGGNAPQMAKQARARAEAMEFDLKTIKQDYESADAICAFHGDNYLRCEAYRKWRWRKPRVTQPLIGPELIERTGFAERAISYLFIDGNLEDRSVEVIIVANESDR